MAACKVIALCIRSSYDILIDLPEAMHKDLNWRLFLMCNISSQIISFIVHASHLFNIFVNSVHYHSDVQNYAVWFSFLKLITENIFFFITAQQTTFGGSSTNQVFAPHFLLWIHLCLSDGNKRMQRYCCKSKTKDYSSVKKKTDSKCIYIFNLKLLEKNI